MKIIIRNLILLIAFVMPSFGSAILNVGIGKSDITPPIGVSSAGYQDRKGEGMEGVHDPLLATALFIDNDEKKIVLCSVDHLGFTYEMVQAIVEQVHHHPGLEECEIYIASSHTHSGGGAYLNIPVLGKTLAGSYSPQVTAFYIEQTLEAIIQASQHVVTAKIGIGYGLADDLSCYRGLWPIDISPLRDVSIIKVTHQDNTPLAVLFNYPVHPTVLNSQNRLFSSDFVGYARDHIQSLLGEGIQPIYFNGAQGDITPKIFKDEDRFESCDYLGKSLAETIEKIWKDTKTSENLEIDTQKFSYAFQPQPTPFGLLLPIDHYQSEMNLIVFNRKHAFLTIPGELSCLYEQRFREIGNKLGYDHVSIFGLTNDAHGYIILPESWRHQTSEAALSFGGEGYGEEIESYAVSLLEARAPRYCAFCDQTVLSNQTFYEDDLVIALLTHKPILEGHCLIIPKRHVERFEMLSDAEIAQIGRVIKKVNQAAMKVFGTSSYLLHQKNGVEVGQTVPHVHFHYIPRLAGEDSSITFIAKMVIANLKKPLQSSEMQELVVKMKEAIE
jgi:diadenosine tetraphosphate (Ap4A) HIT family hydrolase